MKNIIKNIILIILIIAVCVGITFLIYRAARSVDYNKNAKNPILSLEVENYGTIKIELEPDYAPNTVATIIKLAQNGYYNGKVFYGTDSKAVAGGMAIKQEPATSSEDYDENGNYIGPEGGENATNDTVSEDELRVSDLDKSVKPYISEEDPSYAATDEKDRGSEDTDYKVSINGEFVANGDNDNTLRFERGTIGLYRSNYQGNNLTNESYNSGKSLFFITTEEDSSLNGEYAAFGKVIDGMYIIDEMLNLPLEEAKADDSSSSTTSTDSSSSNTAGSLENNQEITKFKSGSFPVITKATVETYGVDYGMPKYEKAFDYDKYMSDLILQYYRNQQN